MGRGRRLSLLDRAVKWTDGSPSAQRPIAATSTLRPMDGGHDDNVYEFVTKLLVLWSSRCFHQVTYSYYYMIST